MKFLTLLAAAASGTLLQELGPDATVEDIVAAMNLREKVGQMAQLEVSQVLIKDGRPPEEAVLDLTLMEKAFVDYGLGSILNSDYSGVDHLYGWRPEKWVEIVKGIKDYAREHSRTGIPPIYGIDSVHGCHYIYGAALFPHNHGIGCSWNTSLAFEAGKVVAKDMRSVYVDWSFGPDVENAVDPLWSRYYESYSEDAFVCGEFGAAHVRGLEGDDQSRDDTVVSCPKHFIGYGAPYTGKDRYDAWIPEDYIREYFMPSFKAAIGAGAHTVMINSGTIAGIPTHTDYNLTTRMLREELGFEGFVISDWEDIKKLANWHRVAKDEKEATRIAILAGIDMSMVPLDYSFNDNLIELVEEGSVPMWRIDEAVIRILRVKKSLGDLDPNPDPEKDVTKGRIRATIGSPEDRQKALEAAHQSMVLLKNGSPEFERLGCYAALSFPRTAIVADPGMTSEFCYSHCAGLGYTIAGVIDSDCSCGTSTVVDGKVPVDDSFCNFICPADGVADCGGPEGHFTVYKVGAALLPLIVSAPKIAVLGPTGNDLPSMCGGWTFHWQGAINNEEFPFGKTLVDGLRDEYGKGIVSAQGSDFTTGTTEMLDEARRLAEMADIIILALGEHAQSEGVGNVQSIDLPAPQKAIFDAVKDLGKPIITVLFQARPWTIPEIAAGSTAVLLGQLPCTEGGEAVADIFAGRVNPSAKMAFTYPRSSADLTPYFYKPVASYTQGTDLPFHIPQWDFGWGMHYSRYIVERLELSTNQVKFGDSVKATATVRNEGPMDGAFPVLLFMNKHYRTAITPEVRSLKAFEKVWIPSGAIVFVDFLITPSMMSFYAGRDPIKKIEPGNFTITVEDQSQNFELLDTTNEYQIYPWHISACDELDTCTPTKITGLTLNDCGGPDRPCPAIMEGSTDENEDSPILCGDVYKISTELGSISAQVVKLTPGTEKRFWVSYHGFTALCPFRCQSSTEACSTQCSDTDAVPDSCYCGCPSLRTTTPFEPELDENGNPVFHVCEVQHANDCKYPTPVEGSAADKEFWVGGNAIRDANYPIEKDEPYFPTAGDAVSAAVLTAFLTLFLS